ncbi:MAG TPA: dTMP kinase [Nocardioidaceae bacterium]|nr:dTMP kinase [Nocardioidaceae bacterium]
MPEPTPLPPPDGDIRAVLAVRPFRRLWVCLSLASLADWIGLLAVTAYANDLAGASYGERNAAIAGVLFVRLLPALLIGPLGGYVADRLDRRLTLVIGLVVRAALFVSIPLVGTLAWLLAATLLIEAVNVIWLPTKDAVIPDLVPSHRLADANRLNLATTYGSALPAAAVFAALSTLGEAIDATAGWFDGDPVALPMYVNAALVAAAALVARTLHDLPLQAGRISPEEANVWRAIADGWRYVAQTPIVRGLVVGIVGAFAAGGIVIALARVYVGDLGADDPGYGVLFAAVFLGLGAGMWRGPRLFPTVPRRRLFGLAIVAAGLTLGLVSFIGDLVLAAVLAALLGACGGVAWITGYTLLGLEVRPALRGRTFAFVQSATRLTLAVVLVVAPAVAAVIGAHRFQLTDDVGLTYSGAQFTFAIGAVVAIAVGVTAYLQMDDRSGESLREQLRGTAGPVGSPWFSESGVFVAFEGGEGSGKSTQAERLAETLRDEGYDVVLTHEPGDTNVGATLRTIVLSPETGALSPRTEALIYAADKAEHVDTVVIPALERGAIVITDRYVDSALAYQGAGRSLTQAELERVTRWATHNLRPNLTVLLDIDPADGHRRFDSRDRVESEPLAFHQRVRASFLELAAADPDHYVIVDGADELDAIAESIRARIEPLVDGIRRTQGDAS